MKVHNLSPILYVTDMQATIRFYRDVLGFACMNQNEGWAALARDEVELMVSLPNAHVPFEKPAFTGSFYFRCDDVDALWQHLKDKAPVVYPIENFVYGMREFAIRDINGYCLQFGQEISELGQIPAMEND
ncbi:MAG TPA: VOC family protein [Candidatus Angelobacter sp.]